MKAGTQLNNLIAEKVMGWPAPEYITDERHDPLRPIYGWKICHRSHEPGEDCEHEWRCGAHNFYAAPPYSTDISAAWQVVEKLGRWHGFDFLLWLDEYQKGHWRAGWFENDGREGPEERVAEVADTAPLAICLAALKAVRP